jgi:hypothetical protein
MTTRSRRKVTDVRRFPCLGLVLLAAMLAAAPAAAQPGVEARMRAFTDAMADGQIDSVAAFFPRRGAWTWVLTTHDGARGDRVGVWRFDAEQTHRAIDDGGPVCDSFSLQFEMRAIGPLSEQMMGSSRPWRRVRGNRFVPRGASAGSPAFVQWRREDGAWVVSAFGDERWTRPRLLGVERNEGRRDSVRAEPLTLPIPPGAPAAAGADWFVDNEPILFAGIRYIKYALPRTLAPGDVTRVGTLHGVGLYAETGETGSAEVLYVPVAPGFEFQPYNAFGSPPCYDPGAPEAGR